LIIGTNDLISNNDLANAPTRLGKLLDLITTTSPKALVVIGTVPPEPVFGAPDAAVRAYNAAIGPLVTARANAGAHIAMVDMYGALTSNPNYAVDYMFGDDKVHPNDAGYAKMADVWYQAIGGLFPAK
jgi:lysophospholipase L1-like esterase